MADIWVCSNCCSKDVEEQVWVKLNSYKGEMALVLKGGEGNCFCPDCGEDVSVCTYDEFGVKDDTEQALNSRLDRIMSEADVIMKKLNERSTD